MVTTHTSRLSALRSGSHKRRAGGGRVRRVAMLSVHTSPLHQPGTGDAGGMNVYIVELAKRLAERDVEVEIFTRATASGLPCKVDLAPGVTVRHIDAGPYEGLAKEDLPAQLCAFTHGVMQAWAGNRPRDRRDAGRRGRRPADRQHRRGSGRARTALRRRSRQARRRPPGCEPRP